MARSIYVGVSSKAKRPSKIYVGGSDGKAHLVKKVYVGGSDGKAHQVWPYVPVGNAYQRCEYIMNTNTTEYINTGFKPNSNTRIELTFKPVSMMSGSSYRRTLFNVIGATTDDPNIFANLEVAYNRWEFTAGWSSGPSGVEDGTKTLEAPGSEVQHVLDFNRSSGNTYLDNTLLFSSSITFGTIDAQLCLFAYSTPSSKDASITKFNAYRLRVWNGTTIIRDMFPCYLKSNTQTVGMWDAINKAFFSNSGTGVFAKGPDVN